MTANYDCRSDHCIRNQSRNYPTGVSVNQKTSIPNGTGMGRLSPCHYKIH